MKLAGLSEKQRAEMNVMRISVRRSMTACGILCGKVGLCYGSAGSETSITGIFLVDCVYDDTTTTASSA